MLEPSLRDVSCWVRLSSFDAAAIMSVSILCYVNFVFVCFGAVLQVMLLQMGMRKLTGQFRPLIVPNISRCLVPLTKTRKVTWQVAKFSLFTVLLCSVSEFEFGLLQSAVTRINSVANIMLRACFCLVFLFIYLSCLYYHCTNIVLYRSGSSRCTF